MKTTNKQVSSKSKLTETIKKLIKMEVKKQLNEMKIPKFISGKKAHPELGDGYDDGLDTTKLDKETNEFKFTVGKTYTWNGILQDEQYDKCEILCLGFHHSVSFNASMAYFLILDGSDKGKFIGFLPSDQKNIK